jgi:hypothetical protein
MHKLPVFSLQRQKLVMTIRFYYLAFVKYTDVIYIPNRAQSVSNGDGRFTFRDIRQCRLQQCFRLCVEC